jgi:sporulation protein YlmC with PRC-barrel domain
LEEAQMDRSTIATNPLIEASRVLSAAVFNPKGEKLGTIDDVALEKRSGLAVYAILSVGGFLGIGGDLRPIPWSVLKYVPDMGGYVVDIDPKALEGAPALVAGETPRWGDLSYEEGLHRYYGVPPYWNDTIV